jgi:hypothetical protein
MPTPLQSGSLMQGNFGIGVGICKPIFFFHSWNPVAGTYLLPMLRTTRPFFYHFLRLRDWHYIAGYLQNSLTFIPL